MRKILNLAAVLTVWLAAIGGLKAQSPPSAQANTAYGTEALGSDNGQGYVNSAFGYFALYSNMQGQVNDAFGYEALYSNTSGDLNQAFGYQALYSNTTGVDNAAFGFTALSSNTTGEYNAAFGSTALGSNTTGVFNTAIGYSALANDSTGGYNTAVGNGALAGLSTGEFNTALGVDAGLGLSEKTGSNNIFIGAGAGGNNPAGASNNIEIGSNGSTGEDGVIRLGTPSLQNRFYAAGIYGIQIAEGVPMYANRDGQIGTILSSIRFKEDVHDMAGASDKLFQLRPVTYRYKTASPDGSKPVDYGLIAEEVAQVYPDMVAHDADGQILTVQYQKLTPMLLNEVQKLHRQVEAQQETIEKLEAQQETVEMLEQRISALESGASSSNSKKSVVSE